MSLDDLRRQALEGDMEQEGFEQYLADEVATEKMFGMTAAERMFVSIGCFLVTCLGGFLLLLVMEKMVI
jgi:hypothetical protein